MANASAEKLKALGLRHGEKAVVGLAAALCMLLLAMAATQPTIELTPDQVSQAAKSAEANLNRKRAPEDILKRLEEAGIKNPNFAKMVDEQMNNKLVAANFRVANPWVTTEPGAGLLRDMPELYAPSELYAYPGRGGALVYALDEDGNRIPDTTTKEDATETTRRRRGRRRRATKKQADAEKESLRKFEEETKKKKAVLVPNKDKADTKKDEKPEEETVEGPFKEITQGVRWVAVTGTIDYKKLRESYLAALKVSAIAYPNFKGLEVERQSLNSDGTWADWQPIDAEQNGRILNNLPEEEEELTPESARIDLLVDPLPFLKAGYWERVHIASLVPAEKIEVKKPEPVASGGSGMGSDYMRQQMLMAQQQQQQQQASTSSSSSSMMMSMPSYASGPGSGETADFAHTDADTIMIRALDFTVEPEQTYRYRVRYVVFNPNKDREDISPGVDNRSAELNGPWSDPTEAVSVPADVATYVMHRTVSARRIDQVHFQVARWTQDDGVTVVRDFDAGAGDVVGEPTSIQVPNSEGKAAARKLVDFNSRRIVLDIDGGNTPLPSGMNGPPLAVPVVSLLVRPDGQVVLHDQSGDVHDDVRIDTEKNYHREIKESGKKRESSMGSMYSGSRPQGRR